MSKPRPSIYRDALKVPASRIAAMSDDELNTLMARLLCSQAYKCGSPTSEICVNTEGKAKDDGCDGRSAKPAARDEWLGAADTCWQFKAGSAGEPARLIGEVTKRIPRETLANGDRFVVVASGSTNGKKGEEDRLKSLVSDASAASIPTAQIEVIGSERLANWCNQHPAIAAYWAGRPDGLWTLDDWCNSPEHQVPWQTSTPVQSEFDVRRADLDFGTGSVYHLHIQGPPGVGKTRFALELCRGALWSGAVIYIRQASDPRLFELIDSAALDDGIQLTVVADEVQPEHLRPLRDSVERGNGRIRLITVGHSPTPDPARIPAIAVTPLGSDVMRKVINGWYPSMPWEHVEFVVRFADGYVRLAHLAADAVDRNPGTTVRGLLGRDEVRIFLDKMLGNEDRQPLYVVAVLESVGWTGEVQHEGHAVADHFGLAWNSVRVAVDRFHQRFGIAPYGGRYRYISPTPLGIRLAVEAWDALPDLLRSLPSALPSDTARGAYYRRVRSMASNPQAREFARKELAFFFEIDQFLDSTTVRRWSALSAADPGLAARNLLGALRGASVDGRALIRDGARREIVWTLVRLAWRSSSFHDAAMALALLAEAENETWANNASGEFVARYQLVLGGTAVPYLGRMSVLDELLALGRPALVRLVVKALGQVGNPQSFRDSIGPASDEVPEREWEPETPAESVECVKTAIGKLADISRRKIPEIRDDLVAAASNISMLLREAPVRETAAGYFDAVRTAYPDSREPLRRFIDDVIRKEKKYWKGLSPEEISELDGLHRRFQDLSLGARLQEHVGEPPWDEEKPRDLRPLATEILSTPNALEENWPWLTSGDAAAAWSLGAAIAAMEGPVAGLASTMPLLHDAGPDMRLLCGYISARRQTLGDGWYEAWVTSQFDRVPKPVALLFEVAWRCGATEPVARMIAATLRVEHVDHAVVDGLRYGSWVDTTAADVLELVLRAMAETGHRATAVEILSDRMKSGSDPNERWLPLALVLSTAPELIRSGYAVSYHWRAVAETLLGAHSEEVAAAIFREQADRESGCWFAQHGDAESVLLACAEHAPAGVWRAMVPYLSSPTIAYRFVIGFPVGVLERMPHSDVMAWVAEDPEERAATLAKVASKDVSSDETIASRVLGEYGDNRRVASAFFSAFITGMWRGSHSAHWDELAEKLDAVVSRTALAKLRRWASDSSRSLRRMAEDDRQREEEEDLRGR
jgi:DNA polymerase III delta prime subunit